MRQCIVFRLHYVHPGFLLRKRSKTITIDKPFPQTQIFHHYQHPQLYIQHSKRMFLLGSPYHTARSRRQKSTKAPKKQQRIIDPNTTEASKSKRQPGSTTANTLGNGHSCENSSSDPHEKKKSACKSLVAAGIDN